MPYRSAYRSTYRRHRRRRRNSHYGVLIALILVIIIAVPVAFHIVKGISSAIFGGDQNQLVYQIDNSRACQDGKAVDLGAAPYRNGGSTAFVPIDSLCANLGLELTWDSAGTTASVTYKGDTANLKVGSTVLTYNGQDQTLSAAPETKEGVTYVPVLDVCQAFSWQVGEVGAEQGDLIIVSQSKKALDDKKMSKITEEALKVLGPSESQVVTGSILMRTDSDKLILAGVQAKEMAEETGKRGSAAIEVDGTRYIPLKAAMAALGGSASFDGKEEWTVEYNGMTSTVRTNGKTNVNGDRVKGDEIKVYQDDEKGRFYVSAQLFAALTGKHYTDLGEGSYAFTDMDLNGFDSQKAHLNTLTGGLTQAIGENIPDADVYVALTFDDGPTGAKDGYPDGMTATLLDGLKERGVHATFFMCGYRLKDFHSHCARYLAEGHELGNHTMNHPMEMLPALSEDRIREEIESNSQLIEQYCGARPTVMRPVGGSYDDKVQSVMKELGLPIINWDVDTLDWKTKTDPQSVKQNILDQVEDGSIVLMHDLYSGTIEGVLAAIDELQSRTDKTYAFVTVSELAAVKGVSLEPGQVYTNIK